MGVFQNNLMGAAAAAASAGGGGFYSHEISNSVRFNASASSSMYRTQGTPTNVDKCTISLWVKRGKLGAAIYAFTGSGNYSQISFGGDGNDPDKFFYLQNPGSPTVNLESAAVFRDPSAWYHVVIAQDSTQGTDSNRNKIYINGVIQTNWVSSFTAPFYSTANSDFLINTSGNKIFVGSAGDSGNNPYLYFDGYIAEYVFIDGTQNDISDFGETKNGVWIPKDPSGLTFGNNGCYLKFESSSDLGNDSSGNNNDFTVSNVSAHDQMTDTPTFNSDSNAGNFATWNPLNAGSYTTLTEGNLKATGTSSGASNPSGTFAMTSGKWYWEMLIQELKSGYPYPGLTVLGNIAYDTNSGGDIWAMRYDLASGSLGGNSGANITGLGTLTTTSTGVATVASGDIVSFYLDCDNRKAWIAKNGTIPNSGNPANGTNPQWAWTTTPSNPITFTAQVYNGDDTILNAGQDGTFAGEKTAQGNSDDTGYGNFYYDPPTGFLAMCSGNLPLADAINPAETDDDYPQKLFSATIWTGNGSARTISSGSKSDAVWIKRRSGAAAWAVQDSTRGTSAALEFNTNAQEDTSFTQGVTAFGSSSFNIGTHSQVNTSSETYVGYAIAANGGTTSSDASGDITSVGQVDPSGCFSIVTYTGSGTQNQTVAHHLSQAPTAAIFKRRDGTKDWMLTAGTSYMNTRYIALNETDAAQTGLYNSGRTFSANAGSSLMTLEGATEQNGSSYSMVAYFFSNCEGYIKIGEYEGNGNADGSFVNTGFRPALVVTKRISGSTGGYLVHDNARNTYNPADKIVQWNESGAEFSGANDKVDMLSNGFKVRSSNGGINASGSDYLYIAMAHNPFKYATAR